jgi:signal transduction histidine kinase
MNGTHIAANSRNAGMFPSQAKATHVNALDDAIHHLAQPLTALMFVIEMGRLQPSPDLWKGSLDSAGDECRRAIAALDEVRAAASVLASDCKEDA